MDKFFKNVPRERMVAGYRRTVRGIRAGQIRCVLIARDADENIIEDVHNLCAEHGVPYRFAPSKREMGERLGLDVPCAIVGENIGTAKF